MPAKIKDFSVVDIQLYEFVWKFCEKQLRRGYFYYFMYLMISVNDEPSYTLHDMYMRYCKCSMCLESLFRNTILLCTVNYRNSERS